MNLEEAAHLGASADAKATAALLGKEAFPLSVEDLQLFGHSRCGCGLAF
jgi:hypothetical protein